MSKDGAVRATGPAPFRGKSHSPANIDGALICERVDAHSYHWHEL